MIEFILIIIWLFVVIVCLEGIFNVVVRGYYDYKNNKKLKQLKRNIKWGIINFTFVNYTFLKIIVALYVY